MGKTRYMVAMLFHRRLSRRPKSAISVPNRSHHRTGSMPSISTHCHTAGIGDASFDRLLIKALPMKAKIRSHSANEFQLGN